MRIGARAQPEQRKYGRLPGGGHRHEHGPSRHGRLFARRASFIDASMACALMLAAPGISVAQTISPATVTPPSLAPDRQNSGFEVDIPPAGALQAPAGAETLATVLGDVRVDGAFAEVTRQVDAVVAPLKGRRTTLAEIYAAASAIEAIHARAGYVLARVSVPPQQLSEGGTLHILVTDGFIERVDTRGLSVRVRNAAQERMAAIQGRRHITLADIEQPLLFNSDLPGLALRSTLMRGGTPGGTTLVLEGKQRLLTGSLGMFNQLDRSLGDWGGTLQLALNSPLGLGEQFYGFAASNYRIDQLFQSDPRMRVLGAGAIVPLGNGRFSLNPEVSFSRTAPASAPGGLATVGALRRLSLRSGFTALRMRSERADLGLTVEQIDDTNSAPGFDALISHDRFMALRLSGTWNKFETNALSFGISVQLSQGLGDLGAIGRAEARTSGTPFSRQNASTGFTKLILALHATRELGAGVILAASLRGQTSFGKPLFRAEQVVLEGNDGLSAYVGGRTAVDQGWVTRDELSLRLPTGWADGQVTSLTPYAFVAFGMGRLENASAVETARISAVNLGAGLRAGLWRQVRLTVEYARAISNYAQLDRIDRVTAGATVTF